MLINQSCVAQQGLVKARWTDRSNNTVVDEFIVFPDEVTLKKINTGKENDRVYLLNWNQGTRKLMFWMQDKNPINDTENCSKFNNFVKNPNQPQAAAPDANNWMQILGLGAGAAPSAAPGHSSSGALPTPASASAFGNLDLSSILQGIPAAPPATASTQPALFNLPPMPPT